MLEHVSGGELFDYLVKKGRLTPKVKSDDDDNDDGKMIMMMAKMIINMIVMMLLAAIIMNCEIMTTVMLTGV